MNQFTAGHDASVDILVDCGTRHWLLYCGGVATICIDSYEVQRCLDWRVASQDQRYCVGADTCFW
jgi:hypothetical protein